MMAQQITPAGLERVLDKVPRIRHQKRTGSGATNDQQFKRLPKRRKLAMG